MAVLLLAFGVFVVSVSNV
jgi:hypothetical protein